MYNSETEAEVSFSGHVRSDVASGCEYIHEMPRSCIVHVTCQWQKEVAAFQCARYQQKCGRGADFCHICGT